MFPSIYVSHGAPSMVLERGPAYEFLSELGAKLGKPDAIVCISAHWDTRLPAVSGAPRPETIHDFYGFPPPLYQVQYPATGAPDVARRVEASLKVSGLDCVIDPSRGLDHGAWSALIPMYPRADVPVLQVSVQSPLGPAHHIRLGQALARLRNDGVLILASGSTTHNLREFGGFAIDSPPPPYVTEFTQWVNSCVGLGDVESLADFRSLAPHGNRNHPSDEHFLPLVVAMAAGSDSHKGTLLHDSYSYGILSMSAYAFE